MSATPSSSARPERALTIVSGGQTGIDRGALDAALENGFLVDGWCPAGRRAEDGVIDGRYPLRETESADYAERTTRNVRDSDGTVLISFGAPKGGTALTRDVAQRFGRPLLLIDGTDVGPEASLERVRAFVEHFCIVRLNVAGPRASEADGAAAWAHAMITGLAMAQETENEA